MSYGRDISIFKQIFEHHLPESSVRRILIVGCGDGQEAVALQSAFSVDAVGIDLETEYDESAKQEVPLLRADARKLPFNDATFDLVYSYHVLEHIPNPAAVLKEINRVLKSPGCLYIGTPNRNRIVGYLGSGRANTREKFIWNLKDYRRRLAGTFENNLGAHAGFDKQALEKMLGGAFDEVQYVADDYFKFKYPSRSLAQWLIKTHLDRWAFPSIYFLCKK